MNPITPTPLVRLLAALLIVTIIGLSALAMPAPTQIQSPVTLKNIQTDQATLFCADRRANRAWFVEMVLPNDHYADRRAARAWFVEMVLPTGDRDALAENLKSVAATL